MYLCTFTYVHNHALHCILFKEKTLAQFNKNRKLPTTYVCINMYAHYKRNVKTGEIEW